MKTRTIVISAIAATGLLIGCSENTPSGPSGSVAAPEAASASILPAGTIGASRARTQELRARLAGRTADPAASGSVHWEQRSDRRRLSVEVEDVATSGKHGVRVNGIELDAVTVVGGIGDLNLDSRVGHAVPVLRAGDKVEVYSPAGILILSGEAR